MKYRTKSEVDFIDHALLITMYTASGMIIGMLFVIPSVLSVVNRTGRGTTRSYK